MRRSFSSLILLFLWLPVIGCGQQGGESYQTVSAAEAAEMIASQPSLVLLDVRTAAEYNSETGHLSNAVLIPVQELAERIGELDQYKSQPLLVYCRSGNRSKEASDLLVENGFNVTMMNGGITAWVDEGLPVERGSGK